MQKIEYKQQPDFQKCHRSNTAGDGGGDELMQCHSRDFENLGDSLLLQSHQMVTTSPGCETKADCRGGGEARRKSFRALDSSESCIMW